MIPRVEPVIKTAPPRPARLNGRTVVVVALVVVCVVGAAFSLIPHGHHQAAAAPTILAPQPPFAGIPTSLEAIVRIEAESSRHTAMSTVITAAGPSGAALTLTQLASAQPSYQWILGSQPSTTNTMISITSTTGSDVVAVSGTNREICAYRAVVTRHGVDLRDDGPRLELRGRHRTRVGLEHARRGLRAGPPRRERELSRPELSSPQLWALSVSRRSTASTYSSTS